MAEQQRVTNVQEMDPAVQPYWDRMMERAENASNQGYTPYGGQRVAGPSAMENASWQGVASLGMAGLPESFRRGEAFGAQTLNQMQGMGQRGYGDMSGVAGQFGAAAGQGYGDMSGMAGRWSPAGDRAYGDISGSISGYQNVYGDAGNIRQWTDGGLAEQYMNPYQRLVNDIGMRDLEKSGARQQTALGSQAATMGAFGGARQGLMQEDMNSNLRQQIQDNTARGQRDSYAAGMGAFNADRNALMQGRGQQLQALGGQTNAANLANAAKMRALQGEQSSLFQGNQLNMQGLQGQSNALMGANQLFQSGLNSQMSGANTLAQIGGMGQDMNLRLLNAMNNAGQQQRGIEQNYLNAGYQDFVNQRDWERQQTEWMNNMLQGLPQIGLTTTSINQNQPPWFNAAAGSALTGSQTYNQAQR